MVTENVGANLLGTILPAQERGRGTATAERVLDFWGQIKGKMADLIDQLSDENTEYVRINGRELMKGGAALAAAIDDMLSEDQFTFSQLMQALQYEQQLEKQLNQAS